MIKEKKHGNIAVLSLLAMFMVTFFYMLNKNGATGSYQGSHRSLFNGMLIIGEIGFNLITIISGYLLVKSEFKWRYFFQNVFYIESFNLLAVAIIGKKSGIELNSIKDVFRYFFPILNGTYWFATIFILLLLLAPFTKRIAELLSQKELKRLLITLLIIFSLIPTYVGIMINNSEAFLYYNRLIWLVTMQYLGAYIGLYGIKLLNRFWKSFIYLIVLTLIFISVLLVMNQNLTLLKTVFPIDTAYFWRPNSFFAVTFSLLIFMMFKGIKLPGSKILSLLSTNIVGCYLLADGYAASFLWKDVLKVNTVLEDTNFIWKMLASTAVVFLIGLIMTLIQTYLFKLLIKIIDLTTVLLTVKHSGGRHTKKVR